jgi:hypothetical protein
MDNARLVSEKLDSIQARHKPTTPDIKVAEELTLIHAITSRTKFRQRISLERTKAAQSQ